MNLTYHTTLSSYLACSLSPAAFMVLAFSIMVPLLPLCAQGIESKQTLQQIIGSDVEEETATARGDTDRIITAINKTVETTSAVRKIIHLDEIEIVFLVDAADEGLPSVIEALVQQHEPEIAQLQNELEGNAMLYHAIDSRQVMFKNIIAVELQAEKKAVVFVASRPTG